MGFFEELGIIKLLKYGEVLLEKGNVRVQLAGRSYNPEIDGGDFQHYYLVKKQKNVDFTINMIHGMLLDRPFGGGIKFTLVRDILGTEADITLSGHYHTGFGVVRDHSRYFINPGSLVRVTRHLSDNVRRPKVVVIDLAEEIRIKEIELSSAPPAREALDGNDVR